MFYDYIPANKAIPNKLEAYSTPENIKAEIEQQIEGTDLNIQGGNYTYDITGAELSIYEQEGDYDAGKPDPFSASPTLDENNEGNGSSGGQSGSSGSGSSTNQVADPNSTGTFFENQGLK